MKPALDAYRLTSLCLAVVFAAVGLAFVLLPGGTVEAFNAVSRGLGMREAALGDNHFFVILAGAYMVLVTSLAWSMARFPQQRVYPLLLAQAKGASALLSFALFLLDRPLLIYLANGVVDGALCALVVLMAWSRPR
jgi:hypothetical protein